MKLVQIGFSRSNDPEMIGSIIIAESEKRPYSHAFCIFTDEYKKQWVLQASHGKVNLQCYEDFISKNIIAKIYDFQVSEEKYLNFMDLVQSNLGVIYSRCQIIWLVLKKAFQINRWPDWIYKYIKNDKQQEICSELQLRVFAVISHDYKIPDDLQIDQFTPSDLETVIKYAGYISSI